MTLSPPSSEELSTAAAALQCDLIAWRRAFHAYPELSGEESRTAKRVATLLTTMGVEVVPGVGGHGVVGVLRGAAPGRIVGCRADMDALPIQDALDVPYKSLVLGVKHACGHDAHMTIALGTARLLAEMRQRWAGTVVFLFQPAEESLDGARAMLEDGVLTRYPIETLLALHVAPLPAGTVGLASGLCLAGMEEFRVRFYAPDGDMHNLVNHAITTLQALSNARPPNTPEEFAELFRRMETDMSLAETTFLSCWHRTEGAVPPYHMLGLISIADFSLRPAVRAQVRAALDRVVSAHGASYDLEYTFANPPLRNDQDVVGAIRPALVATVGENRVRDFRAPYPFSHEDFAHFAARIPAALFWLGTADPDQQIASILHTPDYDINEMALCTGTQAMTAALLGLLHPPRAQQKQTPEPHSDTP